MEIIQFKFRNSSYLAEATLPFETIPNTQPFLIVSIAGTLHEAGVELVLASPWLVQLSFFTTAIFLSKVQRDREVVFVFSCR